MEEEEIDENDVEIVELQNQVYRFIQKSKDTNGTMKDFKFKIRRSGSLSAARQSILATIIKKKLNLGASDHIEIVDDSEGNDHEK